MRVQESQCACGLAMRHTRKETLKRKETPTKNPAKDPERTSGGRAATSAAGAAERSQRRPGRAAKRSLSAPGAATPGGAARGLSAQPPPQALRSDLSGAPGALWARSDCPRRRSERAPSAPRVNGSGAARLSTELVESAQSGRPWTKNIADAQFTTVSDIAVAHRTLLAAS